MAIERSVFVEARQWFEKSGGNSYFSARIHIDGKLALVLPFQYGYGNQFEYEAVKALWGNGHLPVGFDPDGALWRLRDFGIDAYSVIYEAKKADVVRFGKAEVFA
jgi:hypothetical protein